MNNFLEELVAEWFEYNGYFVRRNINVGKRPKGGYECELDIVAIHPLKQHLVHVEPSMDADSWPTRQKRFKKKFDAGRKHIPKMLKGLNIPSTIEQIALFGFASSKNHKYVGGGKVETIQEYLENILNELKDKQIGKEAIPESFIVLRAIQFVLSHPRVSVK